MTTYPYKQGKFTAATGKQPGTEEFVRLMCKRYGFKNLGTWVLRNIRGGSTLSTHATGNAFDAGYQPDQRADLLGVIDWLTANHDQLGVVAVHDYAANPPRAWRCDRNAWQMFPNGELGPGGRWFHIELDPVHGAMAARDYRAIWVSIPKP